MIISVVFLHLLLAANGENGSSNLDGNFQYPDVSNHKNINLLPKNCGEKNKKSDFPWLALLSYDTRSGRKFACGGSIINQNYILTSAQCVTNPFFNLTGIRVGTDNVESTTKSTEDNLIQDASVEEVIIHPKYAKKIQINDIALVRVSPIDLSSETVQSICLPLNRPSFDYSDVDLRVAGWNPRDKYITKIMATSLSCLQKSKSQLCVSPSCLAMAGAPLHVVTPAYGELRVQEGIFSFGLPCENPLVPDVYTRVTFFMDWILDNIGP